MRLFCKQLLFLECFSLYFVALRACFSIVPLYSDARCFVFTVWTIVFLVFLIVFECFAAILSVFFNVLLCFSMLCLCFKRMCAACCSVSQCFA